MKYLISAFFAFFLLLTLNVYSQNNKVIAGPMVSFVDSYGTQMWFLLESDAEKITVDVRHYDTDKLLQYEFDVKNTHRLKDYIPFTIVLEKLQDHFFSMYLFRFFHHYDSMNPFHESDPF